MTLKNFEYTRNLQKRYQNYRRHVALMNRCIASWSPVPLCRCSLLPAKLRIIYMPHQRANLSFMIGYQLTRMLSKKKHSHRDTVKKAGVLQIKAHHLLRCFGQITQTITIHFLFVSNLSFRKKIYFPAISRPPFHGQKL